jgi:hypothetical protein
MVQPNLFDMVPDGYLTEEEAKKELAPFASKLVAIWRSAWNTWLALPAEFRGKMLPRTRANIVHDLAIAQAKEDFRDVATAETCEALGFFKLYIGERVLIRLKRVNQDHLACNIQTEQQRLYYLHESIGGIRDGYTRLTIGYTLNPTHLEIDRIVASLQNGLETLAYSFYLDADDKVIAVPVEPTPLPDVGPTVRIKGAPKGQPEHGT